MTEQASRIPGLDTLRALAIMMVMASHLPKQNGESPLGFLGNNGLWGVDLFFVLSGYLIGNQLLSEFNRRQTISLKRFYVRRLFRTLPSYLVVLAIYFVVPAFRENPLVSPLWKFLTFTQNFNLTFSAFSHAWSLCIEEQFYFLLPLVTLGIAGRFGWKTILTLVLALLFGGMILRGVIWANFVKPNLPNVDAYFRLIYYPTWSRLDGLIFGVSIATLRNASPDVWARLTRKGDRLLVLGIFVALLGILIQVKRFEFLPTIFGYPIVSSGFALAVLAALSNDGWFARARLPGATFLASLAYTLYLLHKQMYHVTGLLSEQLGVGKTEPLVLLCGIVLSFLAAMILRQLVEKPFLRLRNRFS